MTTTTLNPTLSALIARLDHATRRHRTLRRTVVGVAAALAPALGQPDLLTDDQRAGDEAGYRQHLLHVAPDGAFSLVALVWLAGQHTPIHDHLAWCVVGVHEGVEHEIRYRRARGRLVPTGTGVNRTGSVAGLAPPGDIHLVRNPGPGPAISLHVYGADLRATGSSIRRTYDLPVAGAR